MSSPNTLIAFLSGFLLSCAFLNIHSTKRFLILSHSTGKGVVAFARHAIRFTRFSTLLVKKQFFWAEKEQNSLFHLHP
jgi:hypothetical protein